MKMAGTLLVVYVVALQFWRSAAAADTGALLPGPQPVLPANGSTTTSLTPHLQWQPLFEPVAVTDPRIGDYQVQIATAANFAASSLVLDDRVHSVISRFIPSEALLADRLYFWRVRAWDAADTAPISAWSPAWSLAVQSPSQRITLDPSSASWQQMVQAFQQAAAQGNTLVQFSPPANRTLSPPTPTAGAAQVFVNLANCTDVVIDGKGSVFTFTAPVTFVLISNCTRATVRDFSFDLQPLPYTAVRVVARGGELPLQPWVVAELYPGHPTIESNPAFGSYGISELMDPTTLRVKRGGPLVVSYQNISRLQGPAVPTYNISFPAGSSDQPPLLAYQDVDIGDAIVIDPRIDVGFNVLGSQDVVLANVTVFACANECFNSIHGEGLAILGAQMRLRPGRFLAANNGGHNHHSARHAVWIEKTMFENNADDMCHVSGIVASVKELVNQTHVLLEPTWPDEWAAAHGGDLRFQAGDVLAFWNHQTGTFVSIRNIVRIDPPDSQGLTPVWLDGTVGSIVPGSIGGQQDLSGTEKRALQFNASVTQVFNLNQTANQLVFRRNHYRNGRRVGLLAKGSRALVEDNVIEGTGGGGLELWPAPYEGLCASDYMVRNNMFNDTNQLNRTSAPVWTTSLASHGNICHHRIVLRNNTLAAGPGSTFLLQEVSNVLMDDNTILRCATDPEAVVNTTLARQIDFAANNRIINSTATWLCVK